MTKRLCIFILLTIVNTSQLCAKEVCTELKNFKENYTKLLNDLKVEGRDVQLDSKGFIIAKKSDGLTDKELRGNQVEQELYKHYNNALIKIAKAYQFLNKDSAQKKNLELLKANDEVAAFFRVIDPLTNDEMALNKEYNLYVFLEQMQKIEVQPNDFKLTDTDKYFLTKLLTHSQDKICTLRNLHKNGNDAHDYLPLTTNQIILSLKKLTKNDSLDLVKEDAAIMNAINTNIERMRTIIRKPECFDILKARGDGKNLKNIYGPDRKIQACNYGLFLETLKNSDYDNFDTILHFINANQLAKDGKTGLDWINDQFINQKTEPPSCIRNPNGSYSINDPSNTIDDNLFSCDKGSVKISGRECFELFDIKVTSGKSKVLNLINPKDSNVELSIDTSVNCKKLKFSATNSPNSDSNKDNIQSPVLSPCTKESCEKNANDELKKIYSKFSWDEKEAKCLGTLKSDQSKTKPVCSSNQNIDNTSNPNKVDNQSEEEKCKTKNKEYISSSDPGDSPKTDRYIWDGKNCIDKQDKSTQSQEQSEQNPSVKNTNDKQGIIPRFVPINIPTRQMFVLPGMP